MLLAGSNTLDAAWPEPNLTDTLIVRARGTLAGGTGPTMQVLVDGILVGSAKVNVHRATPTTASPCRP